MHRAAIIALALCMPSLACQSPVKPEQTRPEPSGPARPSPQPDPVATGGIDALCDAPDISPAGARRLAHVGLEAAQRAFERRALPCNWMAAIFIGVNAPPRHVVAELEAMREKLRLSTLRNAAGLYVAKRTLLVLAAASNQRILDADGAPLRATLLRAAELDWWIDSQAQQARGRLSMAAALSREALLGLALIPHPDIERGLAALARPATLARQVYAESLRREAAASLKRWRRLHR